MWAPNAIWKTFDLFVGAIQAFIFALLTILYFSQSMELDGRTTSKHRTTIPAHDTVRHHDDLVAPLPDIKEDKQ